MATRSERWRFRQALRGLNGGLHASFEAVDREGEKGEEAMPVKIAGKDYVTVHERVSALHEQRNGTVLQVETWIAQEDEKYVTFGARVTTPAGTFTGHARSDKSTRSIEGQSPLEVAETSAVGRALGFAGFGITEGIATADEVKAAQRPQKKYVAKDTKAITKDTPEAAARRKLWAVAQEKGMDEAALYSYFGTESLKSLAEHMKSGAKDCGCQKPHNFKDLAAGYRWMADLLGNTQ